MEIEKELVSKLDNAHEKILLKVNDWRISSEERLAHAKLLAASFIPDKSSICETDLHCHSFFSDGLSSPSRLIFEAFRRGMKALAISDHDNFDGQHEAILAGDIFGVDVIPAAEFYTDRPGIEIIAHFPSKNDFIAREKAGLFKSVVEELRRSKARQLRGMLERVPDCFSRFSMECEITEDDIARHVRNGISTKGDISVIMWAKYGDELKSRGLVLDVKEFQAKFTTKPEMLDLPLETSLDLSPAAFVRRVLEWGGLPGLSHPTELRTKEGKDNAELFAEIEYLAELGLQTIEVDGWRNKICPECGVHQTELFESMRLEWNKRHPERLPLLFTNGSDDHMQEGEGLEIGSGKNGNLNPEYGLYSNIAALRERYNILKMRTPR